MRSPPYTLNPTIETNTNSMATYCYIVSIKATPDWLRIARKERIQHWAGVRSIVQEFEERVSFEYYDADAFHATHSDMIICETGDIADYHHMWDRIKDTAIFAYGYYSISDVRMGIKGVSHG